MTERRPTLRLKPAESAASDNADRLASLIDTAARQQAHTVPAEQNRGKLLYAGFADHPELLASMLELATASGCSVSASPSCAVAFRLLQPATMPSGETPRCPGCGGPRLRPWKCHECWNEYQRGKQGDRREKAKRALEIVKRSGLS
jgi:hypothetical protein